MPQEASGSRFQQSVVTTVPKQVSRQQGFAQGYNGSGGAGGGRLLTRLFGDGWRDEPWERPPAGWSCWRLSRRGWRPLTWPSGWSPTVCHSWVSKSLRLYRRPGPQSALREAEIMKRCVSLTTTLRRGNKPTTKTPHAGRWWSLN